MAIYMPNDPVVYELAFHPNVPKDLRGLDKGIRQRILSRIEWLADHGEEIRTNR